MNYHAYKIAIGYLTLFLIALLLSGLVMFILKTGMEYEGTLVYYNDKSIEGLLELAHPHLGGMGLTVMVLGHLFLFTSLRKRVLWWTVVMFLAAFISIIMPFMLLAGYEIAVGLKLAGVITLVSVGLVLAGLLLRSVLKDIWIR